MNAIIGQPVRRREDIRFITGRGRYTDDIVVPGQTYAVFVRSPHARAKIRSVDTAAAMALPGVVGVFTGADLTAGGIGAAALRLAGQVGRRDRHEGRPAPAAGGRAGQLRRRALRDRHRRDPGGGQGRRRGGRGRLRGAGGAGQPGHRDGRRRRSTTASRRTCRSTGRWATTPRPTPRSPRASHVTTLTFANNRLIPNAIEPRACVAVYDSSNEEFTLYTTSQNPHLERLILAAFVGLAPEHKLRVVSPDVGGGFGSKIFVYPEETAAAWAARQLRRPVKWTADRSEAFLSDAHGRDHLTTAELALDAAGMFLGLRVKTRANLGAYLSTFGSSVPTYLYGTLLAGQYRTPAIFVEVDGVYTNTAPVDAYRGAGRPEATYVVERMVETAARELGIDPVELRRRNFIQPDQFPYQTPVALIYDIGDYGQSLDRALQLADVAGFPARRAAAEARGRKRGLGYSCYIEACGLAPSQLAISLGAGVGLYESGEVRVNPTGSVTVFTGSHSHGQGHETTFAQVIASKFGIPIEQVEVVHGDTGRMEFGLGTYGSRSLAVGGSALVKSAEKVIDKGKKIAGHMMETTPGDVDFDAGIFRGARHQPADDVRRGGAGRLRAVQLPRGAGAGALGEDLLRSEELHLPGRIAHRRGGDRSRDRRGGGGRLHRGRRLRRDHQSDDRRGPGPRRRRPGHRPGAAGDRRSTTTAAS